MFNKRNTKGNTSVMHIAVHTTGTRPEMRLTQLDNLNYHYLVTRSGKLLSLKPVKRKDKIIDIAWLGGIDKSGKHVDNRTPEQNDTLFNTLMLLSERCDIAEIVPADKLYPYGFPNPGFDLKKWLAGYIPDFLLRA